MGTKSISINFGVDQAEAMRRITRQTGRSASDIVRQAMAEFLARHNATASGRHDYSYLVDGEGKIAGFSLKTDSVIDTSLIRDAQIDGRQTHERISGNT
jgi:hypothetical protein